MDRCSLCKTDLPEGASDVWTNQKGESISISRSEGPCAVADTSVGELTICELCYGSLPSYLLAGDLYEILYQFGLELENREEHERSVRSRTEALSIERTADALAALAYARDRLGQRDDAIGLYHSALELDPEHSMSLNNLEKMTGEPTST